ncbi:MAG: RNA helicase [Elusimicrobia bacterium CG11_big_fil_rev_8_21_14_0_20_64_6]|nr:MAG: RNA helicase [Elusimicrobia bacterium CG11_big_fil_rev_8_21_14_0_20_64_6]
MKTFDDLKLSPPLARAITELGYSAPTEIQQQALPILLGAPTDFIGQAATGTGKTAAFGIPLLERVDTAKKHVQGLILCPTRELAVQVSGQINLFGKHKGVKAVPIYGGTSYSAQLEGLKHGAAIVVGTPGRIIDLIDRGALKLASVKTVVLDEADEMISMGFKEDLEKILKATPRETGHIWLFSATMSPGVRRVADTYLRKPKQVQINRGEMLSTTVEQIYYLARESDKIELIVKIIESADDFYGLVFCQTKALVMDVVQAMIERGYKVDSLHGDKTQHDRDRTMNAFRAKKVNLLICTDVASRGLDVKDLTHVINFSIPREMDVYVHRIGRTARSGKAGRAISLVSPSNRHMISRIEHMTKSRMKEGKIPTRQEIGARKVSRILTAFQEKEKYFRAAEFLGPDWELATDEMDLKEIIARFLCLLTPETFEDAPKPATLASVAAKPPSPYHRKTDHKGHYKKRPR